MRHTQIKQLANRFLRTSTWVASPRRTIVTLALLLPALNATSFGQERNLRGSDRLGLGIESNRSASVRIADLDGDNDLDVITANGRHWPQQNYIFLNQGNAKFSVRYALGAEQRTSYAAEPADLDGDGDLDIVVGNDMAPNQVFFNDGQGQYSRGQAFGKISSVRSLTVVDIDQDGDVDILSTCRGRQNLTYLNDGSGQFGAGHPFGNNRDSTIDVAVNDWNCDGHLDLILANRDNQRNAILLGDGATKFNGEIPFGSRSDQSRAVAVGDLNGDSLPDIVIGNVGQPNRIYFADGKGGIAETSVFGRDDGRTYTLAIADLNQDGRLDLVVGNQGQQNAVFFNDGRGQKFTESRFGTTTGATYGLDVGDLDGDGFIDVAVANSDAQNFVYLNRPVSEERLPETTSNTSGIPCRNLHRPAVSRASDGARTNSDWPAFRGRAGRGVAEGFPVRSHWNADRAAGELEGVLWTTQVPGLGHSSPVIVGDRIFLTTAVASHGDAPLEIQGGGRPDAADDQGEQSWLVLCYDRQTGNELWRRTAYRGPPRATRHGKATHANASVAVDGDHVVAFFGSEGIYCYDRSGTLKWSRDLGVINISKYGIGWGYASSPAIHDGKIAIVCDDPQKPFVATLRLSDGQEIWRTSRKGICERSWGTPFIHTNPSRNQIVVNGWPWIVSYDLDSGEEFWRIRGGGDNPVPTPFEANGWIYITNAHGAESPIFVVHPDASGEILDSPGVASEDALRWSTRRGGSYMSTPVVYGDCLYLGNTNGIVRCFHAQSGEKKYEKRLGSGAAITASLVAADGKIFCASENGAIYVLDAKDEFKVLARNAMGQPCFATPAISQGVLFIRTKERLVAIR